jgi:hypothetical protein
MNRWKKVAKKTPDTDRQVIAFSGDTESHHICLASFSDGKWWAGHRMELGDVTRWMDLPGEPKDFAYWRNRLSKWWGKRVQDAEDAGDWLKGWTSSNAQLGRKVVFYKDTSGKVITGLPENVPAPFGYQKIVCNSALEAERLSGLQRRQEQSEHRIEQERRGSIEAEFQREIRSELHHKMGNARNNVNREFLRRALERNEGRRDPTAYERESYLHAEAHEDGH